DLRVAEYVAHVQLRVTEHRVDRRADVARALVDPRDELFADLEADVRAIRIEPRALEQELRLGAADLDLDRPAGHERRALAAELLEVRAERIDVLADPHSLDLGDRAVDEPVVVPARLRAPLRRGLIVDRQH